jgi:hypothetical protein
MGTLLDPSTRISGFYFKSPVTDVSYSSIAAYGTGWRVHHCTFEAVKSETQGNGQEFVFAASNSTGAYASSGLVDNNIFTNGGASCGGGSNFAAMGAIWDTALDLGTINGIYIEDNTFLNPSTTAVRRTGDCAAGGRLIMRYNTFGNNKIEAHGLQTRSGRGTKSWEFYGNVLSTNWLSGLGFQPLAGTGVVFYNGWNEVSGSIPAYPIAFGHERSVYQSIWGVCDGNPGDPAGWDGNTSPSSTYHGWPCRDQIGTTTDASLFSDPAGAGPAQTLAPAYVWGIRNLTHSANVAAGIRYGRTSTEGIHVKENRDYFTQRSAAFTGAKGVEGGDTTSGVGCGTLANRPVTCTVGVGYWATDQSCTDLTGMIGATPGTPISGTLYKCTATDTWTSYYTPYTYPHPLRTDEAMPSYNITVSHTGTGCSLDDGVHAVLTGGSYNSVLTLNNGWKGTWAGTCGATGAGTDSQAYTKSPTADCTVSFACSAIPILPWVAP